MKSHSDDMHHLRPLFWWIYAIVGILLLTVIAPALISARDTFLVVFGLVLLVMYGTWSWYLWIKALIELGMPKVETHKHNDEGKDDDKK